MPARKPQALINSHETKAQTAAREHRESLTRPAKALPLQAPALLDGHDVAQAAWRRTLREFAAIDGEIVTRLDMGLLVDYCLAMEQLAEVDVMRKTAFRIYEQISAMYDNLMTRGQEEKAANLIPEISLALTSSVKMDTRADRKRDLIFRMRQNMYLTPRARAGVAPKAKETPTPVDEFEQMLNEINQGRTGGQA